MSYLNAKIADYLADAAAGRPTPGGGSVSAFVAALGTTMSSMAANFTVGRKKFAHVEPQAKEILTRLDVFRACLVALVDEDVAAYTVVGSAYSLPRDTEDQKAVRHAEIQKALTVAMDVPLRIMDASLGALECAAELVDIANPNLLSDAGVSAVVLDAGLRAAKLSVEVNLAGLHDRDLVSRTRDRIRDMTGRAKELRDRVLAVVEKGRAPGA